MSIDPYCDLDIFINQTSFTANKVQDDSFRDLREPPLSYETYHVLVPKISLHNNKQGACSFIRTTNKYSNDTTNKVFTNYLDTFTTNLHHQDLSPVLLLQADSGVNWNATNNIDLLRNIRFIVPHQIGGIGSGITCTTIGNYYLRTDDSAIIKFPIFYSVDYQETVISPHNLCDSNNEITIFTQQGNTDTGEGFLMFQSKPKFLKQKYRYNNITGYGSLNKIPKLW